MPHNGQALQPGNFCIQQLNSTHRHQQSTRNLPIKQEMIMGGPLSCIRNFPHLPVAVLCSTEKLSEVTDIMASTWYSVTQCFLYDEDIATIKWQASIQVLALQISFS